MKFYLYRICFFIFFLSIFSKLQSGHSAKLLTSTEADPECFIEHCNILQGDYCESVTDLAVVGPDTLLLQRYYNAKNYITGEHAGGWRIFPQCFLVMGVNLNEFNESDGYEWSYAFTGERSGGILTYSGWRTSEGITDYPLSIDILNDGVGMVNTYAKEINGQTNHQNNLLHCKGETCEIFLGDGTRRVYERVKQLPISILGEELIPFLADQVKAPEYFHLSEEILPSGNHIFFLYDLEGHLASVEIKNTIVNKTISWINFTYELRDNGYSVRMSTSDKKTLEYDFTLFVLANGSTTYALTEVRGSHINPCSYQYQVKNNLCLLQKKIFGNERFVEVDYDSQNKVTSIKKPNAESGKPEIVQFFEYKNNYTDVKDITGLKTRYRYDDRLQLTSIEKYNSHDEFYRLDQKIWGLQKDLGRLQAKSGSDENRKILFYSKLRYDDQGNVLEKALYGNLSGTEDVTIFLDSENQLVDESKLECYKTLFSYSDDGFNLLTKVGDSPKSQVTYTYKNGTNLCTKEFSWENGQIKNRIFRSFNDDAVCVKITKDDSWFQNEQDALGISERHIQNIQPKEDYPGIGLPEILEEMVFDPESKQEMLSKKFINTFDDQGNLLVRSTYDANDEFVFSEQKEYNEFGYIISETNFLGQQTFYTYDVYGNRISTKTSHDNKLVYYNFDYRDQPVKITENIGNLELITKNIFDVKGRKTASIDHFENTTNYEYDDFGRLYKVIFPKVINEKNQVVNPTFTYSYDVFGNVISECDPCGYFTQKTYNLYGNLSNASYPDGSSEVLKYHLRGDLHRFLSRDRIITFYEYDHQKRIVTKNHLTSDGGLTSAGQYQNFKHSSFRTIEANDTGLLTKYKYDVFGRPISITSSPDKCKMGKNNFQKTEIIYDSLHRICKKKVWFDNGDLDYSIENFEYDLAGNTLSKSVQDIHGKTLLQRGFVYDSLNRCIEEYVEIGGEKVPQIKTLYNLLGEPISYKDALGNETKIFIDYSYINCLGQKVIKKNIVNPLGFQTEIEFDALGRVVKTIKKDMLGQILSHQSILYNACGNKCVETHDQIFNGEKIGESISRWNFGPMGRLDEEIEAVGTDKEKRTTYTYNNLGQLISKGVAGFCNPLECTYHPNGLLKTVKYNDINKIESQSIFHKYDYNEYGEIARAVNENNGCIITRDYNEFRQMTCETFSVDRNKYSISYDYDCKGRIKKIVLPDQSSIIYTFDGVYCREVKRFSSTDKLLFSHVYNQYDESGRLINETLMGEVGSRTFDYDLNGKVIKINIPGINFSEVNKYDALGHLVEMENNNHNKSTNISFNYNGLAQLIFEKGKDNNVYAYDSLDNRRSINSDQLSYNALNQLKVQGNAQYNYDLQGNLSNRKINQYNMQVENNILSQVVQITKADKKKLQCKYDSFGRRLVKSYIDPKDKKIISKERYIYLGEHEIGTIDEKSKILQLRVPGIDGEDISLNSVSIELNNKIYASLHGTAGNLIALVDPSSLTVAESYAYSAFGKESIYDSYGREVKESLLDNPWRYAEKRIDKETGFVFFGRRYYDPKIGRWISPDPLGKLDGPNTYAYVHNNPLNSLDRFGLVTEDKSTLEFKHYFSGNIEWFITCCGVEPRKYCLFNWRDVSDGGNTELPRVVYCDNFENMFSNYISESDFWNKVDLYEGYKPYYEDSKTYDLNLPERKNFRIGFINGMDNNFKDSYESTSYISRLASGYNVHAVYNATHGKTVDIKECQMGLNYIATEPVRQLHKMWNKFFDEADGEATFLMICHSQGAIHVRNALLDYPESLRNRIIVAAIAPGGYIYQQTCSKVTHYRVTASRDLVPYLDQAGAKRSRETIVELQSDKNAPFHDHSILSPTYQRDLTRHIDNYMNKIKV